MKEKTLAQTNPHLKDTEKRKALIRKHVIDSSAIEGIDPVRLAAYLETHTNQSTST